MESYRAPPWLPGGHAQTVWPALFSRPWPRSAPLVRRERWNTPDGDFVDVDHLDGPDPAAPRVVLFHGLEGSRHSPYGRALGILVAQRGWNASFPHFRGCSGEDNVAPRAYHSGDFEEVGWMLGRLRARATGPLLAFGISLGGNALLRWAQEAGIGATAVVRAVAAVSAPLDLEAAGRAIDTGVNRWLYARHFLRSLKPKALRMLRRHPGLFSEARLRVATTMYAFDDVVTAPLHGYAGTLDYWRRASSKPHLHRLRVPTLVLNARNDPFVPAASLPGPADVGPQVTLWQPDPGGHAGFPSGPFPGQVYTMPGAVLGWLAGHV